jgi:hypothetical protein
LRRVKPEDVEIDSNSDGVATYKWKNTEISLATPPPPKFGTLAELMSPAEAGLAGMKFTKLKKK